MLQLEIINPHNYSVNSAKIKLHLEHILRRLNYPDSVSIEIKFCNEGEIQQLNTMYRNNNSTTDVLSFNATDNPELLGSIAICSQVAFAQASQAGITVDAEYNQLATHGLLHLLGYNHK
ncbi:rRNA maturation RNase YbeY [Candidatus Berkelbacteria bacterium]|nr:rRNA maturation RNase YbeY [Candidatus Berkelbacteria bacterium]